MEGEPAVTRAVALRYDRGKEEAPRVVASGQGFVAGRILEVAEEAGVPVTEDAALLELLAKVPLGSEIPVELYQAVAEVLAFVYRVHKASPG
jgi:flagellar biosynthesis protein